MSSLALSPDGRRIASGSGDHTLRIWDADTGQEINCRKGPDWAFRCLAYAPDSFRIAGAYRDGNTLVWDSQNGQELARLAVGQPGNTAFSLAFSPDGRQIASGHIDGTVRLWDSGDGRPLACLQGPGQWVTSVTFSPDGARIAGGFWDGLIQIWGWECGDVLACLRGGGTGVARLAFSDDGRRIVSDSRGEHTVRIWDEETRKCLATIDGEGDVQAIACAGVRLRALARGLETVIGEAAAGIPLAWFLASLRSICAYPSGRRWAGSDQTHICIVGLEGGEAP